MKRKIWREPTKEDLESFFERWASRQDLAKRFAEMTRLIDARDMFEPILLPDGSLPESMRLSRRRDYEEAYKEIFGRHPDDDQIINEALRLYEDI